MLRASGAIQAAATTAVSGLRFPRRGTLTTLRRTLAHPGKTSISPNKVIIPPGGLLQVIFPILS
jgi:hypothetical protein